jgi:hypothetical protein
VTLLWLCLAFYGVLAVAYKAIASGWIGNSAFLATALLAMFLYRWINWDQNRWCQD